MRNLVLKLLTGVAIVSVAAPMSAQTNAETQSQGGQRQGGQRRGGGGGEAEQRPGLGRAADALDRVTFRTRTMLRTANRANTNWINWRFGIAANGLGNLTFLEAIVRADAAQVNFI